MTISNTLQKRPVQPRLFTVEEANATLPLVRAIVGDLVALASTVEERGRRIAPLLGVKEMGPRDPYREELVQMEKELAHDVCRVQEYVEELRAIGVEPKSGTEGLVDFPALLDGRKVYLCWKLGEPEVLYWHELKDGFAGRQLVSVEPSLTKAKKAIERLAHEKDPSRN